jgi:hypothetical protein
MLKGVVVLAPKQREPSDLKNWRRITLLNTDHKLIARCLAKRITQVLPQLISSDQSYCVPGRSIHTNLQLLRDAIEYANTSAVISLYQDSVEKQYLYRVLHRFGIGPGLISCIKTMYNGDQGLVKIRDKLISPFPCNRGLRQGDPPSGPLLL